MEAAGDDRSSRRALRLVLVLLVFHAVWLGWSATWQSPTLNEPGHLASGLAHWKLGRFEPYAVNPPLVRMIAAAPVLIAGCETDWSRFRGVPGERPEFPLGSDFISANGDGSQRLFVMARWACVPFSLLGAWMCFVWGRALAGPWSGVLACGLWCFEPNVIAHGQLITSDAAASSLGLVALWMFWRWLRCSGWGRSALAGGALGLAILAKFSWLVLVGVWPILWLVMTWRTGERIRGRAVGQLLLMGLTAVYVINVAYAFDGSFGALNTFDFSSRKLAGPVERGQVGNRFAGTVLGRLPVPLPRQFVLGLDLQSKDFEEFPHESYLRGEWRQGGWWWYYLYAAAVKIPVGLWLLAATALVLWWRGVRRGERWPDQIDPAGLWVLLVPMVVLFALVSSQMAFNHHFRYVLPCFGPGIIVVASLLGGWMNSFGRPEGRRRLLRGWIALNALWIGLSSAWAAPFSLSYFNELAGGMHRGAEHLLHSNIDWGQDLVALEEWIESHADSRPVYLAYYGFYNPLEYGVNAKISPQGPFWGERPRDWSFRAGWYAVSVNYLHGTKWRLQNPHAYQPLLNETPAAWCGGSIAIYFVDDALAERLTEAVLRRERGE